MSVTNPCRQWVLLVVLCLQVLHFAQTASGENKNDFISQDQVDDEAIMRAIEIEASSSTRLLSGETTIAEDSSSPCQDEVERPWSSALSLGFAADPLQIPDSEVRKLEELVVHVYNMVASQTCVHGYRKVLVARIDETTSPRLSSETETVSTVSLRIDTLGQCQGCGEDARLFSPARGGRSQYRNLATTKVSDLQAIPPEGKTPFHSQIHHSRRKLNKPKEEEGLHNLCRCVPPGKDIFLMVLRKRLKTISNAPALAGLIVNSVENAGIDATARHSSATNYNSNISTESITGRGWNGWHTWPPGFSRSAPSLPPAFSRSAPGATPSPTRRPSLPPTQLSTPLPTEPPATSPSANPSSVDSEAPTLQEPSGAPSAVSGTPSSAVSDPPSLEPSQLPSLAPSSATSEGPSTSPTTRDSIAPSTLPSEAPSVDISAVPSLTPSDSTVDSAQPSQMPSNASESPTVDEDRSAEPSQSPSQSSAPSVLCLDECCSDRDCTGDDEVCFVFAAQCIDDGSLRFTLFWEGDDDLDLYVETPEGFVISPTNPVDPVTGGRVGEDTNQPDFGRHIESTFFPETAPDGTYRFYQIPFNIRDTPDFWLITIFVDGIAVQTVSGVGLSDTFEFEYTNPT